MESSSKSGRNQNSDIDAGWAWVVAGAAWISSAIASGSLVQVYILGHLSLIVCTTVYRNVLQLRHVFRYDNQRISNITRYHCLGWITQQQRVHARRFDSLN